MPKGVPNKRYTPEFKVMVVETILRGNLSYYETERQFELPHKRAATWKRIYLPEEDFLMESRGRGSKECPTKLPKDIEKDLLS